MRLVGATHYADLRGPTACELITEAEVEAIRARLGPDPLRRDADPDRAWARISRSRAPLATLLMDQTVIAGVGNVYRAELLFRHGLDPQLPGISMTRPRWDAVWTDLVALMRDGARRGKIETLRPEDDPRLLAPRDRRVTCARMVYAYRRTGQPCLVCGTPIAHSEHAARNLFWCPTCQPAVSGAAGQKSKPPSRSEVAAAHVAAAAKPPTPPPMSPPPPPIRRRRRLAAVGGHAVRVAVGVGHARHPAEHGAEQQRRAHAPGARDERRPPPGLGVPTLRHRPPGHVAAGVVVRVAARGHRRGAVGVALDLDVTLLAHRARALLARQRRQVGTGVEAHRRAGRAYVVEALVGGLGDLPGLGRRLRLVHLRARRVVALGGVGEGLLGRLVGADEVEYLATEALDPPPRLRPGILQLASLRRPLLADEPEHACDDADHHEQRHDRAHVTTPHPRPHAPARSSTTTVIPDTTFPSGQVVAVPGCRVPGSGCRGRPGCPGCPGCSGCWVHGARVRGACPGRRAAGCGSAGGR